MSATHQDPRPVPQVHRVECHGDRLRVLFDDVEEPALLPRSITVEKARQVQAALDRAYARGLADARKLMIGGAA